MTRRGPPAKGMPKRAVPALTVDNSPLAAPLSHVRLYGRQFFAPRVPVTLGGARDFWRARGWDVRDFPRRVSHVVNAFEIVLDRGAPPTVNRYYNKTRTPLAHMNASGRWVRAPQCENWEWHQIQVGAGQTRYPRAGESARAAANWTGGAYGDVCAHMRGEKGAIGSDYVITALHAFMKHSAPVAPAVPRELASKVAGKVPAPLVLWRGVKRVAVPVAGSTVSSGVGCFTAFTYDKDVADGFSDDGGTPGFLFRLPVDRIARGTPWVWFDPNAPWGRRARTVATFFEHEREVLLPPGYFKVLGVTKKRRGQTVVDVAFVASPEYVRRGAVPTIDAAGRAVTRTVRGNALVSNSRELLAGVRARRELIARAVARLGRRKSTK